MSILLSFDRDERRRLAIGELAPLAKALRAELEPLMNGPIPIPQQKAQLTRTGGRCSFDGTYLNFDPFSPHEHQCRQCHRVFIDRAHDDWWAMGAQLWVAERAVQAAALNLITDDRATGALALRILDQLSSQYKSWPNQDNALGPTRPFFSTYLESIWLLNLCHAIALLEEAGVDNSAAALLVRVRETLVRPSRDLIAVFHEGRSNRQVWNEVAILSASRVLSDEATVTRRLAASGGLYDHFANGLLDDGTWYEGENYHLFAHRGLWYGVQLLRALNRQLPDALEARYRSGFATPFLGVLPDDTLPSRRDSQYRVSLRQWRFAEWCELGVSHALQQPNARVDERLVGMLHRLYDTDNAPALEPQRRHQFSTADAERNEPAGLLSRADLSWRALLMAAPALPKGAAWSPGSVCLPRQGLAVLRRERGDVYIALEGGHTGGGHGHPDRLALTLQHKHSRWLEDPGTGSYVDPTLHWYRSTLAHAAPLIDGASQEAVPAELLAFEDRGGAGWISKRVKNMKPGVNVQRTIVACDGYLIDLLEWDADRAVQIDLPVARHVASTNVVEWHSANPGGASGLEDGFDFLESVEINERSANDEARTASGPHSFTFRSGGDVTASVQYVGTVAIDAWRATAPGAPGQERAPLHWLRMRASSGSLVGVWSWTEALTSTVSLGPDKTAEISVVTGETQATHTRTPEGWHIALKARHATSSMDLVYLQKTVVPDVESLRSSHAHSQRVIAKDIPHAPRVFRAELGKAHYLRTEQSWEEAGGPSAIANFSVRDNNLVIQVSAMTGEIVVPAANAVNQFDNERADVNADGIELFVGPNAGAPWTASWLVVPADTEQDRALPISESRLARTTVTTHASPRLNCTWEPIDDDRAPGYTMQIVLPLRDIPIQSDGTFAMELVVNERPLNRARRRGMLVLSGGGAFAYLRGDRADSTDALTFLIGAQ